MPGDGQQFHFTATLVTLRPLVYGIEIPARVIAKLGRRGPVPVIATLNEEAEVHASLVPMGQGRYRLQLNTRIRRDLGLELGDRIRVALEVPAKPVVSPAPSDLSIALKAAGLFEMFSAFPAGKQNHIIGWLNDTAKPETRERRLAKTIEALMQVRERAYDKAAAKRRSSAISKT